MSCHFVPPDRCRIKTSKTMSKDVENDLATEARLRKEAEKTEMTFQQFLRERAREARERSILKEATALISGVVLMGHF